MLPDLNRHNTTHTTPLIGRLLLIKSGASGREVDEKGPGRRGALLPELGGLDLG